MAELTDIRESVRQRYADAGVLQHVLQAAQGRRRRQAQLLVTAAKACAAHRYRCFTAADQHARSRKRIATGVHFAQQPCQHATDIPRLALDVRAEHERSKSK